MKAQADSSLYQEAVGLAETGKYQEALTCIEEYLRVSPNDVEALNDAGAILHCLGRFNEAIEHLARARKLQPDSAEIVWNLVEAYLGAGRADQIGQLYNDMERMGILNADVLNRTANLFLNQSNKADALEMLLRSLKVAPNQEVLEPILEVIRCKRPKIAFFCPANPEDSSITDICAFAQARFRIQHFQGQNVNQMYESMKTSDICWFEGCSDVASEASRLPKVTKNIVKLHGPELQDGWPRQVQWENIDILITIGNSGLEEILLEQVPDIKARTRLVTIPKGVDLEKFKFVGRQPGKNLACIGNLNMQTNPMFLLQCMQKLHYIDPEYRLFFAGAFQNPMLQRYIRHMIQVLELSDVVLFDGWQEDVNCWLQDKNFIVSVGIGQSQEMGLLQGMACGLKPVIHNFPGASEMFPSDLLFDISEQFCERILAGRYEPESYRKFVEERYPLKSQLEEINAIFIQLEREIDIQQAKSSSNIELEKKLD
jgi:hypothetical protein